LPILTIEAVPDLASRQGLNQLLFTAEHAARLIEDRYGVPLRLVVIETNIAAFAIDDWNNPAKVSVVTRAMSRIANASGGAVLGVAHHGKDISKGVAGSFAQKANVDFILSALMTTGDDALTRRPLIKSVDHRMTPLVVANVRLCPCDLPKTAAPKDRLNVLRAEPAGAVQLGGQTLYVSPDLRVGHDPFSQQTALTESCEHRIESAMAAFLERDLKFELLVAKRANPVR
jgi:hypothetical protein